MVYIYVVCKRVYEGMKVEEWGARREGSGLDNVGERSRELSCLKCR